MSTWNRCVDLHSSGWIDIPGTTTEGCYKKWWWETVLFVFNYYTNGTKAFGGTQLMSVDKTGLCGLCILSGGCACLVGFYILIFVLVITGRA